MRYISTRGGSPALSFRDVLLGGLAPDGGLYLPECYPQVDRAELDRWRDLSYADLAFAILSRFIDDIPPDDLKQFISETYTPETFRFVAHPGEDAADIVPLHWLEPGRFALLSLANGPTLTFNDMAMQLLGNLFAYTTIRRGEILNILSATSNGDTGSAVEYALHGKYRVQVFMLSPHERMSAFQQAQMYSLTKTNIHNIAVTGMSDTQDVVKALLDDAMFKAHYRFGAVTVNALNWAWIAAQIVYYFKAYFAATRSNDEQVVFAMPTGDSGNLYAGHIARCMGLPIARLILAANENDMLDEFFHTGCYRPGRAQASNFERFIFDLVGRDATQVCALWEKIDQDGAFDLSQTPHFAKCAASGFAAGKSTHADRIDTIRDVFTRHGVIIDPHTADGVKVAREHTQARTHLKPDNIPMIVLETAQAAKFADTIREAIGRDPERPAELAGIEDLPQKVNVLAPEEVKAYIATCVQRIPPHGVLDSTKFEGEMWKYHDKISQDNPSVQIEGSVSVQGCVLNLSFNKKDRWHSPYKIFLKPFARWALLPEVQSAWQIAGDAGFITDRGGPENAGNYWSITAAKVEKKWSPKGLWIEISCQLGQGCQVSHYPQDVAGLPPLPAGTVKLAFALSREQIEKLMRSGFNQEDLAREFESGVASMRKKLDQLTGKSMMNVIHPVYRMPDRGNPIL